MRPLLCLLLLFLAATAHAGPQLSVQGPTGANLVSGSSTVDSGLDGVGSPAVEMDFTLLNPGNATLNLGTPWIDGTNAADFAISTPLGTASLGIGGSQTLLGVTFTASVSGAESATLHIPSNDPASPFNIALKGTGASAYNITFQSGGVASPAISASAITATGIALSFLLNYAPAPGTNLTVIHNTGTQSINGTFTGLAPGQQVQMSYGGSVYTFVANYHGGAGNDLVLDWAQTRLVTWGWNQDGALGVNDPNYSDSYPITPVYNSGVLAGKTVIAVAAGGYHSLALCADGTLAAWGDNSFGELGINNSAVTSEDVPVAVFTGPGSALYLKSVIAIAAGLHHSLALCSDGTVVAWGWNYYGELGVNSTASQWNYPVRVATSSGSALATETGPRQVTAICAGAFHSLALCADGGVVAWGYNAYGQLGDGGMEAQSNVPVNVLSTGVLSTKTVTALSAGLGHSVALYADGTVATWGENQYYGALGNSDPHLANSNVPVLVDATATYGSALYNKTVTAIAAGYYFTEALCSDGTVVAWGQNYYGQLGNTLGIPDIYSYLWQSSYSAVPVAVDTSAADNSFLNGQTVVAISAAAYNGYALLANGNLAAWGLNEYGNLGDPSVLMGELPNPYPEQVDTSSLIPGEVITQVVSGSASNHSFAIIATPPEPQIVVQQPAGSPLTNGSGSVPFGDVAAGGSSSAGFVLGDEGLGQLTISSAVFSGSGYSFASSFPASLPTGGSTPFTVNFTPASPFLTYNETLQINSNDPVNGAFVVNLTGIGTGTLQITYNSGSETPLPYPSASNAPVSASNFTATGSTVNFTLDYAPAPGTTLTVVHNTGPAFIQGTFSNLAQGQAVELSYSNITYNFVANYFGGATGRDLVLEWAYTRPAAWGCDSTGQLGDGDSTYANSPTLAAVVRSGVLTGKTLVAVAAGGSHSLALCSDGTVAAWGDNTYGQLGDGGAEAQSIVPVAVNLSGVLLNKTVIAVAAGMNHSVALCADGTVAAWGDNSHGQLGNGDTTFTGSNVPVLVSVTGNSALAGGQTVVEVSAGNYFNIALCSNNLAVTWGDNTYGQLGNADPFYRNSVTPVAVQTSVLGTAETVTAVSAGGEHCLALCADSKILAWGNNTSGQLGNLDGGNLLGNYTVDNAPVLVMAGSGSALSASETVVAVAAGGLHSLALCSDGHLLAWGDNTHGQLGNNDPSHANQLIPQLVDVTSADNSALSGKTVAALYAGAYHSLVQCADGTLAAWGDNTYDELGNSSPAANNPHSTPPLCSNLPVTVNTTLQIPGETVWLARTGPSAYHNAGIVAGPPIPYITLQQPAGTALISGTSTVNYGEVAVGPSGTLGLSYTVSNLGYVALEVSSLPAPGAGFSFGTSPGPPSSVAPGASASFTVSFTPSSPFLSYSGQLQIPSNDPVTSTFSVNLTGIGISTLKITYNSATETPEPYTPGTLSPVSAASFTATGSTAQFTLGYTPALDTVLTVVDNTGAGPIVGTFNGLAEGQRVQIPFQGSTYTFIVSYHGGTSGSDVVLQWAGPVIGGDYVFFPSVMDSGGRPSSVGNYSNMGSLSSIAGLSAVDPPTVNVASGYIAELALQSYGDLPRIAVLDQTGGELTSGSGAINYGELASGSNRPFTLTVQNRGSESLTLSGATFEGYDFVVTTPLPLTLEAGASSPLVVTFSPTAPFITDSATLQLASNDPVTNPFDINLTGISTGTLNVDYTSATQVPDSGASITATGSTVNFQLGYAPVAGTILTVVTDTGQGAIQGAFSNLAQGQRVPLTYNGKTYYFVANYQGGTGNDLVLQWAGPIDGGNYSIPANVLASGGRTSSSAKFSNLGCLGGGVVGISTGTAPAEIASQGYIAQITGLIELPQLVLMEPVGTILVSGSSIVDFSNSGVDTGVPETFTILNNGAAPLVFSNPTLFGANASDFVLTTPPAVTTVPAGTSTTFVVTFTPTLQTTENASLQLVSNDPVNGAFAVALAGLNAVESWKLANFGTTANTGNTADNASYAGDGISNLLKFATGLNPTTPLSGPPPWKSTAPSNGAFLFSYPQSHAAVSAGITFSVQWSNTLAPGSWSSTGVSLYSDTLNTPGPTTDLITNQVPAGTLGHCFVELFVTDPNP